MTKFDIIIPTTEKDLDTLEECIKSAKLFIDGYRKIIVISKERYTKNADWFPESNFPFSLENLKEYIGDHWRLGWYYQQLLKLYALFVIPDILDNLMCLDSDTIFLKKTIFFKDGIPYYNYSGAYHKPYFKHMKKLDSCLSRQDSKKSGITHHMIFNIEILRNLFYKVEKNHNLEFWRVFMKMVDKDEKSGASEYEIYFNYVWKEYNDRIKLRKLKWENSNSIDYNKDLHYVSRHSYLRK